jgi:hypothetical protein
MKIFSIFAIVMVAGIWTAQAEPATGDANGAAPKDRRTSDTTNTANLLQSALGTHPALLAPAEAEEAGAPENQAGPPEPAKTNETVEPVANGPVIELPDLRDIAGAPHVPAQTMPAYSVNGARIPVFRERDVYNKHGMEYLSFKRHPGLVVGNQFGLNADAAYEMFLEDDWRSTKSDYRNMAQAMIIGGDLGEAKTIIKDVDSADLSVRNDAEEDAEEPVIGQFKLNELGGDSHLLEIQSIPFDLTVLKVKW